MSVHFVTPGLPTGVTICPVVTQPHIRSCNIDIAKTCCFKVLSFQICNGNIVSWNRLLFISRDQMCKFSAGHRLGWGQWTRGRCTNGHGRGHHGCTAREVRPQEHRLKLERGEVRENINDKWKVVEYLFNMELCTTLHEGLSIVINNCWSRLSISWTQHWVGRPSCTGNWQIESCSQVNKNTIG